MVERTDAKKERLGPQGALQIARAASKIVVSRGKNTVTFDMKKGPPDDETLLAHLLGPTGNLRAPTIRLGTTLLVGYNDATYERVLK